MKLGRWLRHATTIPVIAAGIWQGVEAGSRGAFLAAGAAAIAWFAWPEAARLVAWRRRRRAESAKRRPTSQRLIRRAERLATRAMRDVARDDGAREQLGARATRRPQG